MRVLALAWMLAGLATTAAAATFTVTTTVDAPDTHPGDGLCVAAGNGGCTLRAAIQEANAWAGWDQILVPEGSYLLTVGGPLPRVGRDAWGSLKIFDSVHIIGAGATNTVISAKELKAFGSRDRVMAVEPREQDGPSPYVRIEGLTLTDGRAIDPRSSTGGGLSVFRARVELRACVISYNEGTFGGGVSAAQSALELTDVTIANNKAAWGGGIMVSGFGTGEGRGRVGIPGGVSLRGLNLRVVNNEADEGGGIKADSGVVSLRGGSVSGNVASIRGGGLILLNGTMGGSGWLEGVQVSGNSAEDGGGIYADVYDLVVIYSEVSENKASGAGGGIFLPRRPTSATWPALVARTQITQSTISGNVAGTDGGGIVNGMALTIDTSTLSGNVATRGGGLLNAAGDVDLRSSTLYGNQAEVGGGLANVELPAPRRRADPLGGMLRFARSIIAGSSDHGGACAHVRVRVGGGGDFSPLLSYGSNLTDDESCPIGGSAFDFRVPDVLLGPLQFNGGPTWTHLPLPLSPAIDRIACTPDPRGEDQRRFPRPASVPGLVPACDIGAVETQVFTDIGPGQ